MEINNVYDESQIQVLDRIRSSKKKTRYVYWEHKYLRGLHHLVYEIVDNSIDEALAGFCDNIHVFNTTR